MTEAAPARYLLPPDAYTSPAWVTPSGPVAEQV